MKPHSKRLRALLTALSVAVALASPASANVSCTATVDAVINWTSWGALGAELTLGDGTKVTWILCSTKGSWDNGATPAMIGGDQCFAVQNTLNLARTAGNDVTLIFDDNVPATGGGTAATCNEVAQWASGVAEHFLNLRLE